jgi:hypothetical protein
MRNFIKNPDGTNAVQVISRSGNDALHYFGNTIDANPNCFVALYEIPNNETEIITPKRGIIGKVICDRGNYGGANLSASCDVVATRAYSNNVIYCSQTLGNNTIRPIVASVPSLSSDKYYIGLTVTNQMMCWLSLVGVIYGTPMDNKVFKSNEYTIITLPTIQ